MTKLDKKSITLLKAIIEGLEDAESGYTQHFDFEIRGKRIAGILEVNIEDVPLNIKKTK